MKNLPLLKDWRPRERLTYQTVASPPAMSPMIPKVVPRAIAVMSLLLELELAPAVLVGYTVEGAPALPPLDPD
jgi:hypothetical protein